MRASRVDAGLDWLRAVVDPQVAAHWTLAQWDRNVRLARRHRLLARLAGGLERAGLAELLPIEVRPHLVSAQRVSEYRSRAMVWALEQLPAMLGRPTYPLVLLKGAAYMGQNLPIAQGRVPSDLDILVPKAHLAAAHARLRDVGWAEAPLDDRDRRYYLEWSHELPPMTHGQHAMELDVHHNLLPPRAGRMPDAEALFERLQPSRWPAWQVLSPVDQVLHSAAHLFFDSEPRDRVRDLVDLDGLLRHFGPTPLFWDELPRRAESLGLLEPLALACRFTEAWLGTPIPASTSSEVAARSRRPLRLAMVARLMSTVLRPTEPDRFDPPGKRLAGALVLARYHWHRMPLGVLVPHLWRKMRLRGGSLVVQDDLPGQPQ